MEFTVISTEELTKSQSDYFLFAEDFVQNPLDNTPLEYLKFNAWRVVRYRPDANTIYVSLARDWDTAKQNLFERVVG